MSEGNDDQPHKTAPVLPPAGKPFAPGPDPRRNAGGRPRGLARMAREAVGNGADVLDFMLAVLKADAKRLGVKAVPLRDRLQAAMWFTDRGWGRAVTLVELPDEPVEHFTLEQAAALREMPENLKEQIRQWLESRRAEYLAEQCAAAEAKMRSFLPDQPDGNGPQLTATRDAQPERLPTK